MSMCQDFPLSLEHVTPMLEVLSMQVITYDETGSINHAAVETGESRQMLVVRPVRAAVNVRAKRCSRRESIK